MKLFIFKAETESVPGLEDTYGLRAGIIAIYDFIDIEYVYIQYLWAGFND